MVNAIPRSALGNLSKISQGGQGVVYRAPKVTTRFAKHLVYKEYKPQILAALNIDALKAMPDTLTGMPFDDGAMLISLSAWPCAMVEDAGKITGFVMPSIPDEFFTDIHTNRKSRIAAEFQHLLNETQVLARRFPGNVITDRQRYQLLEKTVAALAFLHRHRICVGDLSPKNMLYALSGPDTPAVYFIDCDAMRVNGVSVAPQLETPGWGVPTGEEKATIYSDRYKFALLALRLLVGDQSTTDPGRLPAQVPDQVRRLIADTLNAAPAARPELQHWEIPLSHAASTASNQPPLPPTHAATAPGPPHPPPPQPPAVTPAIYAPAPLNSPTATPTPAALWHPPATPQWQPPPAPAQPNLAASTGKGGSNKIAWAIIPIALLTIGAIALLSQRTGLLSSEPTTTQAATTTQPPLTTTTWPPTTTYATPSTAETSNSPAPTVEPPRWHWDGIWLDNYWESPGDCDSPDTYWVVQPADNTTPAGMSQLKIGCFPEDVISSLNNHGHAFTWSASVVFAVWDPDRIMSEYNKHGDLQMLGLDEACLTRAHITDFHEGPIHNDCLIRPRA